MIPLDDNLYLAADSRQFILKEKKVVQEGDNEGNEYFVDLGYYPTIATLAKALLERELYDAVSVFTEFADVQDRVMNWFEGRSMRALKELVGS